jgi:hypothetical protein
VTGSFVERLVCHARLPLIAGLDAVRPAVHVWESGPDGLRELSIVHADADAYPPEPWKRHGLVPSLAWHPHEPSLVVTGSAGLQRWTPDGTAMLGSTSVGAGYRYVAFSPDGRTLWASPTSSLDRDEAWRRSDALDLATGAVRLGPGWDTGVVQHPGGGLVVALSSDQGATDVLFARPGEGIAANFRVLRDAIVLDVDGYVAPVFSDDGRYLAIRGNAYVQSLDVFAFQSMRKVLHTTLGEPYPGYPYPPEWLAEQSRWSRHNVAFAPQSAVLLVGTSAGGVVEVDLDSGQVFEHEVASASVSALAVTSTGRLVIADRSGRVHVRTVPRDTGHGTRPADATVARASVEEFLAATAELPDDADLEASLVRHDGQRTWSSDDLAQVTETQDDDPTWLRLRAAANTHFTGTQSDQP